MADLFAIDPLLTHASGGEQATMAPVSLQHPSGPTLQECRRTHDIRCEAMLQQDEKTIHEKKKSLADDMVNRLCNDEVLQQGKMMEACRIKYQPCAQELMEALEPTIEGDLSITESAIQRVGRCVENPFYIKGIGR